MVHQTKVPARVEASTGRLRQQFHGPEVLPNQRLLTHQRQGAPTQHLQHVLKRDRSPRVGRMCRLRHSLQASHLRSKVSRRPTILGTVNVSIREHVRHRLDTSPQRLGPLASLSSLGRNRLSPQITTASQRSQHQGHPHRGIQHLQRSRHMRTGRRVDGTPRPRLSRLPHRATTPAARDHTRQERLPLPLTPTRQSPMSRPTHDSAPLRGRHNPLPRGRNQRLRIVTLGRNDHQATIPGVTEDGEDRRVSPRIPLRRERALSVHPLANRLHRLPTIQHPVSMTEQSSLILTMRTVPVEAEGPDRPRRTPLLPTLTRRQPLPLRLHLTLKGRDRHQQPGVQTTRGRG